METFTDNINDLSDTIPCGSVESYILDRFFEAFETTDTENYREYIKQLICGFFIPPITGNYTFNIRSDDLSRLYISPNASKDHLTEILNVRRWTQSRLVKLALCNQGCLPSYTHRNYAYDEYSTIFGC